MSIQVGDKIPSLTLFVMSENGPQKITTDEVFAGKKGRTLCRTRCLLRPGCSITHMPGFVVNADKILDKGVDSIVCTAVNDAFVMGAWGQSQNADAMTMLADGNGELANALGLTMDGSGFWHGHAQQALRHDRQRRCGRVAECGRQRCR